MFRDDDDNDDDEKEFLGVIKSKMKCCGEN